MSSRRITKRSTSATPARSKRLRSENIEAKNVSVLGDLDFYIDDDGNMQPLEIGSVSNIAETSARVASPLAHPNHDQYCWVCHTDGSTKFCGTCIRSFHIQCLRRSTENALSHNSPENWRCPQCKELRNAKNDFQRRQVDLVKFNELLKFIVDRLYIDEELKKFGTTFNNVLRSVPDITIINPIDLNLIEEKVVDSKYESTTEFIVDIKWIFHNCGIAFKENRSIFANAKRMVRFSERELYDIEICPECYFRSNRYHADSWFVKACERPHLPVWAKIKGNRELYWPAKVVACKNGLVDVRFFGDHACAFVPPSNVFLYSKENPNKRMNATSLKQLDRYTEEADEYIANLNTKFSLLKFMPKMTKFEPDKIYSHLHQMLPYMFIETQHEYFRKMKDFTKRDAKQPEKLSLGYSTLAASLRLKPLAVVMTRMGNEMLHNNKQRDDEADVNNFVQSIENTMNIKAESIEPCKIVDPDTDECTVMIPSSDSEKSDDEIEVGSLLETDPLQQTSMDNETHSSNCDRSDNQSEHLTIAQMHQINEQHKQSSKINERSKEPAPNDEPTPSMPIIDDTHEIVTHEEDGIASESGSLALNGSVSNVVETNTASDDAFWHKIKSVIAEMLKRDHRLEQQLYQETLTANKTKMKKLDEKIKVLEKENEHWKILLRDANAKEREKNTDYKKKLNEMQKLLDDKEETIKKSDIEYAAKIEAMKIELHKEWRNKRWCTFAPCGKEVSDRFPNPDFCSLSCMRQSLLQNVPNLNQKNNNEDEINMDEIN